MNKEGNDESTKNDNVHREGLFYIAYDRGQYI